MIKGYMNAYDICANKDNVTGTPLKPIHVHQTREDAIEAEGETGVHWESKSLYLCVNLPPDSFQCGQRVRCIIEVIEKGE